MNPLEQPYSPDVAAFHASLATLAHWMVADGWTPEEMLDAIEKPWRMRHEADAARALRDATIGLDL